jgi:hypothetical protein
MNYRIITLTEDIEDKTGLEILVAELTPIEFNTAHYQTYTFNPENAEIFIFLLNTEIAQSLLEYPENVYELNLDDFLIKPIYLKHNTKKIAYHHYNFINASENEAFPDLNPVLNRAISKCLLVHHVDMYFYFIFRYIIFKEYESKGIKCQNADEIYEKYRYLTAYILNETCAVQAVDFEEIDTELKEYYNQEYADLIKHGELYHNAILNYIIYREGVKKIILISLKDTEPFFPLFFQKYMEKGYKIALNRVTDYLTNTELFAHEFAGEYSSLTLILFPTPLGFIEKETLVASANQGKLDEQIDKYFKKYKIVRVVEKRIIDKLRTRFVFQKDKQIFYYKRRSIDKKYIPFGEQNRQNPFMALLTQGQINLSLYEEKINS